MINPWARINSSRRTDSWLILSHLVLRIAFGGVERLPRINRTGTWIYGQWTIPPGTPVGMDQYHMHMNPSAYPDPTIFRPERWLGNPKGPDGVKPLTHYLTPFARGTRMCTGLNLAYAEIFIGLATLFRKHEFELFETTRRDVDFYAENLKASPWPGSQGVRVLVKTKWSCLSYDGTHEAEVAGLRPRIWIKQRSRPNSFKDRWTASIFPLKNWI